MMSNKMFTTKDENDVGHSQEFVLLLKFVLLDRKIMLILEYLDFYAKQPTNTEQLKSGDNQDYFIILR